MKKWTIEHGINETLKLGCRLKWKLCRNFKHSKCLMVYNILVEMKMDTWVHVEIKMPKPRENNRNVKHSNLDAKRFDYIMIPNKETTNPNSCCCFNQIEAH